MRIGFSIMASPQPPFVILYNRYGILPVETSKLIPQETNSTAENAIQTGVFEH